MEQTSVYGVVYDKKNENAKKSNFLTVTVMSYAAGTALFLEFYLNYI